MSTSLNHHTSIATYNTNTALHIHTNVNVVSTYCSCGTIPRLSGVAADNGVRGDMALNGEDGMAGEADDCG